MRSRQQVRHLRWCGAQFSHDEVIACHCSKSTGERFAISAADKRRVALDLRRQCHPRHRDDRRTDPVRRGSSTPSPTSAKSFRRWRCGPDSARSTSSPSCWWRAAPTASPMRAGRACSANPSSASSPCRSPGITSAARPTRCTRCCAPSRRCFRCGSNSCASICRPSSRWCCWCRPRCRSTSACRWCW